MNLFFRSAFVIFVLLLADVFFIACHKSKDYKYKFSNARFQLRELDSLSTNSPRYLNLDGDTASAEKLLLDVYLSSERIAKIDAAPGIFINNSYAFQFFDNYINTSKLKHIKLTTLKNYNQNYTAGSNIEKAVLFGLGNANMIMLNDTASGDKFPALFNERNINSIEKSPPTGFFWIKLTEKPTLNTPQQIAMEIELEDGAVFRDTTIRFIVK